MFRFSIAMGTFNGGRYLQEQLDSILSQTRLPDEFVVCDDGSQDDTLEILRRFQKSAPFPVEVHENPRRLGWAKNFERTIDFCTGDVVAPCDQDDVWREDKLQRHEEIYASEPDVLLIFNNARYIDASSRLISDRNVFQTTFDRDPGLRDAMAGDKAFTVLARTPRVSGCMMSFRANWWRRIAPVPDGIGHDDWVALCLSLVGRIQIVEEPLNQYRDHAAQVTKGDGSTPPSAVFNTLMKQRADQLEHCRDRICEFASANGPVRFPAYQSHLDGLIRHLRRRSTLSRFRALRAPVVLKELALGRYAKFNDNLRDCLSQDGRQGRFLGLD
ncbi:glycosyltransferase [Paludisphaera rhizosphaerae]|uniref:glycosyltransferase n=1 Tax=Paludisphaera rhizosphaerae TaxID=2711216 RepID=UPI0013EC59AA|nr:glycosyltransferase [Paludisphaera rhizosphaerae]